MAGKSYQAQSDKGNGHEYDDDGKLHVRPPRQVA
jgi:hypothetical protein